MGKAIDIVALCKEDYLEQLKAAGYSSAEIIYLFNKEREYFAISKAWMKDEGGILYVETELGVYLFYILVYPEHRNKGIAKKMLQEFEADMKSKGVASIHLNVFDNNKAKPLYKDYYCVSHIMRKKL